jgi:uncharacterized protein YdaU (DUF1376 family)
MNYYPFHIGDYIAHTGHLSWEEDIAYRRMLDWYYLNEKPLPADAGKVARLVRMPKSLKAVEGVLDEFFTLMDDGWHNKRADQELASMLAKQEQQATKDEHESDRMRRYRERRAQMFAALREAGVVPAWDVPMKELQRLFEQTCNAPETDLQREQVANCNASATAIPTPTPTPTPTPKKEIHPPTPKGACSRSEGRFPEFWGAWPADSPRKTDRKKCLEKWRRQGWDAETDVIVAHVVAMRVTRQWREGYEPAPLTYLNGERWRDGVPIDGRPNGVAPAYDLDGVH